MKNNPGDPAVIETQWKLLQATSQWKRAIAAGEEMVKFDSTKADTSYFRRQVGAAYQDGQPQLALQFLARGTQKFPRDTRLLQAYSNELNNYRAKNQELNKQTNDKQEQLRRTVKALRLALSMLEGEEETPKAQPTPLRKAK